MNNKCCFADPLAGVADGCDPNRTTVRDVMTWQLLYLDEGPRAWYSPA